MDSLVCVTGAQTAQYTLTVTISDVNDFSPVCSSSLYSVSIPEGSGTPIGTAIAQLSCSDADSEPPNNDLSTYTISSGNTGNIMYNLNRKRCIYASASNYINTGLVGCRLYSITSF